MLEDHFKLDLENRFLMLLVYYRLYITYTLAGFLFDLDQSNICRDIQKIESLVRECVPIPQKIYNNNKEAKNSRGSRKIFSRLSCFYRFYRTADIQDLLIRERRKMTIQEKRKDILCKEPAYG